jgi:hypothetical protein
VLAMISRRRASAIGWAGRHTAQAATAQRLRAEHAIGKSLQKTKHSNGTSRLAELNVSKKESSTFQRIADRIWFRDVHATGR